MISIADLNQRQADYQERIERINQERWLRTATAPLDRRASGISIAVASLWQRCGRVLVIFGEWLQGTSTVHPLDSGVV